jgi:hypothetical protein
MGEEQSCGVTRRPMELWTVQTPCFHQVCISTLLEMPSSEDVSTVPEMQFSLSEAQDELRTTCYDGDHKRVSELFANAPLDADDATSALEDSLVEMDPALIRVLLQNGADISSIGCRDIPRSGKFGELLGLLARCGYDFEADGHWTLQSVNPPRSDF